MKRVLFVLFAATLPLGATAYFEKGNLGYIKQIVQSKHLNNIRSNEQLVALDQLAVEISKLPSLETQTFISFLLEQQNKDLRWLSHLRSKYEIEMYSWERKSALQSFFWSVSANQRLNSISKQNLARLKQESLNRRNITMLSRWPLQREKRRKAPKQSDRRSPLRPEPRHNFFSIETTSASPPEEIGLNQSFNEYTPTRQSPESPWVKEETEVDDDEIVEYLRNFTLNPQAQHYDTHYNEYHEFDCHYEHLAKIARDALDPNNQPS
ncbi:hypothetical protein HOD08_00775 [bacterium]|nr:hypothetical protein [bacterium]